MPEPEEQPFDLVLIDRPLLVVAAEVEDVHVAVEDIVPEEKLERASLVVLVPVGAEIHVKRPDGAPPMNLLWLEPHDEEEEPNGPE